MSLKKSKKIFSITAYLSLYLIIAFAILIIGMLITCSAKADDKEYGPISGPIKKPFEPISKEIL